MKGVTHTVVCALLVTSFLTGTSSGDDNFETIYFVILLSKGNFICNGFLATLKSAILPANSSIGLDTSNNDVIIKTTLQQEENSDECIVFNILRPTTQNVIGGGARVNENIAVAFWLEEAPNGHFTPDAGYTMEHISDIGFQIGDIVYTIQRDSRSSNCIGSLRKVSFKTKDFPVIPNQRVFVSSNKELGYHKKMNGSPIMVGTKIIGLASVSADKVPIFCTKIDPTLKYFILSNQITSQ